VKRSQVEVIMDSQPMGPVWVRWKWKNLQEFEEIQRMIFGIIFRMWKLPFNLVQSIKKSFKIEKNFDNWFSLFFIVESSHRHSIK
jgi:hypothetical protein